MENNIIELKDVCFAYEDKPIIKDFSLEIETGSFVCLLGESGSGKSTLLRLMNGLLLPQSGIIKINNQELNKDNLINIRRNMGYVLQNDALFPHLTVYQNMAYCLNFDKEDEKQNQQRICELLPLVKLQEDLLDKFPHELSGGQRQRVGIIRGIAHKPNIVLMDEPFSALDPETRNELQDMVADIHQKLNTTFVMVTHSEKEAEKLGTQIIRLS